MLPNSKKGLIPQKLKSSFICNYVEYDYQGNVNITQN
jgi:hypothetical protein